ncbi:MAG: hypothetical protein JNM78_14120 [Cyclobacteriaceae bacterium]|nr:hypothetical protein [Cyclobacteriaceae bacterium]
MKILFYLILTAFVSQTFAQSAAKAIEDPNLDLKERYQVMKENSQTYGEYKVIKEFILDGFWKLNGDSIAKQRALLKESNSQIAALKTELLSTQNDLKAQQASVAEIVFDSKHISVIGIPFKKGIFLIITALAIAGLALSVVFAFTKMKIVNAGMKEKALIVHTITQEFEEYKHKALDKQTKLSRELQNERNKLLDMRSQKNVG